MAIEKLLTRYFGFAIIKQYNKKVKEITLGLLLININFEL